MVSISMSAVFLAAIAVFVTLSIVALGSSLVLKHVLNSNEQRHHQLSSMNKTFISSLVVALLLIYYYLSVTI